jgi:L-lactate dehydrogenase complex protein LldG
MSTRDRILARVRTALGDPPAPSAAPPVMLGTVQPGAGDRVAQFTTALEKLAGKVHRVRSESEAAECVRGLVAGRSVLSTHPLIASTVAEVAVADVGVTGAAYGLADTGSLVVLSSQEARLASLLPPVHIAILRSEVLLSSLDELLTILPTPAEANASMVLITGPSRTADIEQILVRGVHGPGELHVVVFEETE